MCAYVCVCVGACVPACTIGTERGHFKYSSDIELRIQTSLREGVILKHVPMPLCACVDIPYKS